jgi:hypothetical protein
MPFTAPKAGDPCGHAAMVVSCCWGIQWDETTSRTRDDEAYASLKESQGVGGEENPIFGSFLVSEHPILGLRYHQKHSSIYVVCIKNLIWIYGDNIFTNIQI